METRDWSLVFFTVLTQAAVGAFLVLRALEYLSARRGSDGGRAADGPQDNGPARAGAQGEEPEAGSAQVSGRAMASAAHAGRRTPAPLLVVLAVLSAGLFAALFHLSTPLQAARAVVNFSSSWLSREIVFGSLFAGLLSVLAWHEWREADPSPTGRTQEQRPAGASSAGGAPENPAPQRRETGAGPAHPTSPALATWLPRLTVAAGLAFLGCQIAIYLLPAQPAWNTFATPAAFGGTALRLGILGVAAGFVFRSLTSGVDDPAQAAPMATGGTLSATLRGLALAGIAALALEFVVAPLHLASLAANPLPAAAASVQRLTGDYGGILLLRLGLLGAAAAALGGVLASIRRAGGPSPSGHSPHPVAAVLTCGAFGLTAASEVCGRFLFYAMQVRVGI